MQIHERRLLLVEGRDEVNLFRALIRGCFDDDPGIQVIDAGGKDQFRRNLRSIQIAATWQRRLCNRLASSAMLTKTPSAAFASVCDGIRSANYEPPMSHGEFSTGRPTIGVFIVPDGSTPGAIETLCRRSCRANVTAACVEEYLKCLEERHATSSRNPDKSFAHAYLAATENPVARVGEGALQGVWDFASSAFEPLAQFLHQLAG